MNYYLLKAIIVFQNYRVSRAHKKKQFKVLLQTVRSPVGHKGKT